ncbi:cytochrome P450 [Propioniferax innocua]|uniref:Cytochrome P450 n=1 Tax=Propioniferax innocua TaxID=1753 RepID=A0A542ZAH3_9ACTN|nr:cytochrome P450 [Propioniferax innocua]
MCSPRTASEHSRVPTRAVSLDEVRNHPLRFLAEQAGYGDLSVYEAGGEQIVLANHPDHVKQVLGSAAGCFTKAGTPDDLLLRGLVGEGLLTAEAGPWRRQRSVLAPMFRRARVVPAAERILDIAESLTEAWEREPGARCVDGEMSSVALDVLVGVLLDVDAATIGPAFGEAVAELNAHLGRGANRTGTPPQKVSEARRLIRAIAGALIQSGAYRSDGPESNMHELMRLHRGPDLADQVLTLIMAGHETTARAMSWTLLLLARHEDVQEQVRTEARQVLGREGSIRDKVAQMPLTEAVVRESMRLFPPVWSMSRRSTTETSIGGIEIASGTLVVLSQWLQHHDARWWDDPYEFKPERFLEAGPLPAAYFPFGAGDRICIGQHLALMEVVLVVATILRRLRLRAVGPMPVPEALISLRPADGARVIVETERGI